MISCRCLWCDEPVTEIAAQQVVVTDPRKHLTVRLIHRECRLRRLVGGVEHLRGRCGCRTGEPAPGCCGDPPGMSKHQAAFAASDYWHRHAVNAEHYAAMLKLIFR